MSYIASGLEAHSRPSWGQTVSMFHERKLAPSFNAFGLDIEESIPDVSPKERIPRHFHPEDAKPWDSNFSPTMGFRPLRTSFHLVARGRTYGCSSPGSSSDVLFLLVSSAVPYCSPKPAQIHQLNPEAFCSALLLRPSSSRRLETPGLHIRSGFSLGVVVNWLVGAGDDA